MSNIQNGTDRQIDGHQVKEFETTFNQGYFTNEINVRRATEGKEML